MVLGVVEMVDRLILKALENSGGFTPSEGNPGGNGNGQNYGKGGGGGGFRWLWW